MEIQEEEGEEEEEEPPPPAPVTVGGGPGEANRGLRWARPAAASARAVDGVEGGRHWQSRCSTTDMLTDGHLERTR